MINEKQMVSIVIPCRNEERYIEECLNSLTSQDYPKDKIEVWVVNGMSKDRSKEIVEKYAEKYPFIKLIENPKKITPVAFNLGVKSSKGEIICITGAHSKVDRMFISKNVEVFDKYNADCVGGVAKVLTSKDSLIAQAISLVLFSFFGMGGAKHRTNIKEVTESDTAPRACYKKEVFEKIGLFNEKLVRSQDMEFNQRLKRAGGKIIIVPDILSYYYPKQSLKDFFIHNLKDGIWAVYSLKFVKMPLCLRHYVPLIFILSLAVTGLLGIFFPIALWSFLSIISLYFLASIFFSFKITLEEKNVFLFFLLPLTYAVRHFGYGLGSVWGLVKLLI